jgi:choline dehydrogenase-like flavoprotein
MKIAVPSTIESASFDVVIVGAGINGAIVAKKLANEGKTVLILEAGTAEGATFDGYRRFVDTYYRATAKIPNSPYPVNANAPEPTELDPRPIQPGVPSTNGYFVQNGPLPYRSSYTRYLGGTTLHWLGTSLRMLPEDFTLKDKYQQGNDWPIRYKDLEKYYRMAERELGVSADVDEQRYGGVEFEKGYVYPMHGIPKSWLDLQLGQALKGRTYEIDGERHPLDVIGTPASRNGLPNEKYDGGAGYQPIGAVGNPLVGSRCMGNSSCVPICPIQAKYNALKTLDAAKDSLVTMVPQSVATQIEIDSATGRVSGIKYQHYRQKNATETQTYIAKGKIYILAAHAIENAMLLLASRAGNSSGQVGQNLMDHTELVTWGLAPMPVGPFRGPVATSGIEGMRYGQFRKQAAAFRIEIGNDGWSWPTTSPASDVDDFVDNQAMYGTTLRRKLRHLINRQFRFGILVEQLPERTNKVTIDERYRDDRGILRPVINFDISEYTRAGFELAKTVSDVIFGHFGAKDCSKYSTGETGYFTYQNRGYVFQGAGHYMGTHRMGNSRTDSVVDTDQRSWDHGNLYLVGCGNMVTSATSNPTLTAAALTCWAAKNILRDLNH